MSAEKPVWFEKGLRFGCTGCGDCCRGESGYVWVTEAEIRALAKALGLGLDAFGRRYLRRTGETYALIDDPKGDCIFLDADGRCKVYAARPIQCRTFPWWPELLRNRFTWAAEGRRCPGIDQGKVVPRGEIESQRDQNTA